MQPSPIAKTAGPSLPIRRLLPCPLSLIRSSEKIARTIASAEVFRQPRRRDYDCVIWSGRVIASGWRRRSKAEMDMSTVHHVYVGTVRSAQGSAGGGRGGVFRQAVGSQRWD